MKFLRLFFLIAGCAVVLAGVCAFIVQSAPEAELTRAEPAAPPLPEEPRVLATAFRDLPPKELPPGYLLCGNVEVENITVMAVTGPSSRTEYLSLDDAMARKLCTVVEGGGVNRLSIQSSAEVPIFAMAGDLLLGGNQDRVLAESLVIAPGEKVRAPVFCVEAGRFSPSLRDGARAAGGRFYKEAAKGQVDLNVKRAVLVSRNQSAVWEQVARTNSGVGAQSVSQTGTIRNAFASRTVAARIESCLADVQRLKSAGPVGFAVAIDNRIVAVDLFASAALCARLADKILRGYILTGLAGGYRVKGAGAAKVEGATTLSSRSATTRGQQENLLRYECNDTATGKRVHFCLMAR